MSSVFQSTQCRLPCSEVIGGPIDSGFTSACGDIKGLRGGGGGVTRPGARARQAKRVLTQGRRGVQGRTGASRDKSLKMK